MKKLILIFLLAFEWAVALPLPEGAPPGSLAVAPDPLFGNAITEAFQYGPGIWSNPGKATMTRFSLATKVSANPLAPQVAAIGSGLNRHPLANLPAPFVYVPTSPPGLVFPNYDPANFNHNGVDTSVPAGIFGPAVSLGHPYLNVLSVWFNMMDVPPALADPANQFGLVQDTNLVKLGFFNRNAMNANAFDMGIWTTEYWSLYESLMPGGADFIHAQSRGKMFLNSIFTHFDRGDPTNAGNHYRLKQVFTRHNKRFASFRAIGLNPMWDLSNPLNTAGGQGPMAPRVADYILNSYARYFYNESYRHLDNNQNPNALALVYRTTANMLAYESGHMNVRYAPLDPSCRNPLVAPCAVTGIPVPINNNPHLVNFGIANEFAILYDVLKFLLPDAGVANQEALNMAGTANVAPVSAAIPGRLGSAMPTNMQTLVELAQAIFDRAWAVYQTIPANFGGSPFVAPRASAAFVAAAAMAGKRVDPVFWGHLAEAEQAIMKNAFGNYKNIVDGWFVSAMVRNDLALSLSDFGSYHTNYLAAPNLIPPSVPFDNTGIGELLDSARDIGSGRMALVRGPAGLISLQGDRFETATAYKLPNDTFMGVPFPNAYVELAQSGRAIIDGNLIFSTGNGTASSIDIDQKTTSNVLLPFEQTVVQSYSLDSQTVIGGDTNFAAARGAETRSRSAARTNRIVQLQEDYKVLTGRFKPVSRFSSDSRFFTPALQYWLVISDKLNSNGLDPLANINPPQFANINNMYQAEINKGSYRIKNLATVSYTDSGTPRAAIPVPAIPAPLGNILPLDAYHNSGIYGSNQFPLLVQQAFQRTMEAPFVSPENSYIPSPVAVPDVDTTASPNTLNPNVPATGNGSIPCRRLALFPNRDQSVNCP